MKVEYDYCLVRNWKRHAEEGVMRLLEEYGASYREESVYDRHYVKFKLYDDDPVQRELIGRLAEYECSGFHGHATAIYTEAELMEARLLAIWPTAQGVGAKPISRQDDYDGCPCRRPAVPERIGREHRIRPKIAFFWRDTGFGDLYADRRIRELAEENGLTGMMFHELRLKDGGVSGNLYRLTSDNVLRRPAFELGHGEMPGRCPLCGEEQYFCGHAYRLHVDFSRMERKTDFCMTERIFGQAFQVYPLYLISHRFYRLLAENKLTGSIMFDPVVGIG